MAIAPINYDDSGIRYPSMTRWQKFIQQIKWIWDELEAITSQAIDGMW